MEDKELYDFFKSRKQSVDEAPGDSLWAKIENGLDGTPQAAPVKTGSSLFGKLLILPVLGIVAAIVWMVAYNPESIKKSVQQKHTKGVEYESKSAKTTEDADAYDAHNAIDTIKKSKVAVLQSGTDVLTPAPGVPRPANAMTAADTLPFKPNAVLSETFIPSVTKPSWQVVQKKTNTAKLKMKETDAFKPKNVFFDKKLNSKDSLNPEAISFRTDSSKIKLAEPSLDITAFYTSTVRQGAANEVLITPADSLRSDLDVIQTDIKTEPGRVTITIKQALTKEQFDSFTEKVKKESNHKPGTIIMIIALGHKTFRHKVPKPVGELGP